MPSVKPRLGDPASTVAICALEPFDPRFRATEFALAVTCRALHHVFVLLFLALVHRLPLHASSKGSGPYVAAISAFTRATVPFESPTDLATLLMPVPAGQQLAGASIGASAARQASAVRSYLPNDGCDTSGSRFQIPPERRMPEWSEPKTFASKKGK
jgi:hypothetical protein